MRNHLRAQSCAATVASLTDSLPNPAIKASLNTMQSPICTEPPDDVHFPVGVEFAHEDLGDRTSVRSASSPSPTFVRAIMHKDVSARSFVAHVRYDASAAAIAAVVGAPEQDVENLWLAGVRTPAKHSIDRRPLASKQSSMRFTPQSVLDCLNISGEGDEPDLSKAEEVCRESGLDQGQFADLFDEDKQIDEESLEFANALIERLKVLDGASRALPRYQPTTRRRNNPDRTIASKSADIVSSRVESRDRRSVEDVRTCGFSKNGSHADLDVRCDGFAICKVKNGLYRTARIVSEMQPPSAPEDPISFYFEVVIVDDRDAGGICIGVATESLPLNKLVGSNSESCGLHSSGQLVLNNGEFRQFGKSFKKGDRVGCMATLCAGDCSEDPPTPVQSKDSSYSGSDDGLDSLVRKHDENVELTFYVNGEKLGTVREALWRDVPEEKRRLFPVVSLYKKDSKAVVQCCAKDWAMKTDKLANDVRAICGNPL